MTAIHEPSASPPAAPPVITPTNTMAIVAVSAGVAAWIGFPIVGALIAIFCGHMARSEIRARQGAESGDGLAVAALVLGYSHVVVTILGCLIFAFVFGGFAMMLGGLGLSGELGPLPH